MTDERKGDISLVIFGIVGIVNSVGAILVWTYMLDASVKKN